MTFASYHRVPTLMTYAEALHKLNTTAPIRGRSPELIPLGARKDCDKFQIRLADDLESVDILLYRNACLRYLKPLPDQPANITRVQLMGRYSYGWSVPECWLLWSILNGAVFKARATRSHIEIKTRAFNTPDTPSTVVLRSPNDTDPRPTILRIDTTTSAITQESAPAATVWQIDRAQANNVRRKYGRFYRYAKGMIALRKELLVDPRMPQFGQVNESFVRFLNTELNQAPVTAFLGVKWDQRLDIKPVQSSDHYAEWLLKAAAFLTLISDNEDEGVQAQNFAHAFAALGLTCGYKSRTRRLDDALFISPADLSRKLDEIVFKYHSSTVFRSVPAPEGRVPSNHYDTWVDRE